MRVAARRCAAVCALALTGMWAAIPNSHAASAGDNAAHALADRFSRAEDAESIKAAAAKKAKAEQARAAAVAAKQREAEASKQRAADEADMLARAQAEAAARREADERKAAELDRLDAERETARSQADQLAREAEEQRAAEQAKAEEVRKAEAERLARDVEAQRLAEEQLANEAAERQAEANRLAAQQREKEFAEQQQLKAVEKAKRIAAEQREKQEAERLAHEAERIAEDKRIAEEKRVAEERQAKAAEEKRVAEQRESDEKRLTEAEAAEAKATEAKAAHLQAELEARRHDEAQRVADKFRSAWEAREARAQAGEDSQSTRSSLGGPLPPDATPESRKVPWDDGYYDSAPPATAYSAPPATAHGAPPPLPDRATVLLSLEQTYTKFAGNPRVPHPVLCVGDGCYISTGADTPADYMARYQALGPGNTLGRRAGYCRAQRTCVFRGVALPAQAAWIQPVNMGFWHHDRLDIRNAIPDQTCQLVGRQLYCGKPIAAHGYRAWIVPEDVARLAGRAALENALSNGLPLARSASGEMWSAQALPTR